MNKPYFEEFQSFRQTRWIWYILIIFTLLLVLPVLYGVYGQFAMGIPWGDKPMKDSELIVISMLSLAGFGLVTFVLLSVKLVTRIDQEGIHYRFVPQKSKWSRIHKDDIVEFEVRKNLNFFASGGVGYHKNFFRKTTSMTIRGSAHLWLRLRNNTKLIIGTQDPENLERSMRRLMLKEGIG